jgi:hypothetical protein
MVKQLSDAGMVDDGWVNVAYPLYYWPLDLSDPGGGLLPTVGDAKAYVLLAQALATALLLTEESPPTGTPPAS